MKIAISAMGATLDSTIDPRFGRAAFLLIVESDTDELLEVIDNSEGQNAAQGAGISVAALVAGKGVKAVLTGRVGPKAMPILDQAGIRVMDGISGTVGQALARFKAGPAEQAASSSQSGADRPKSVSPCPPDPRQQCDRGLGPGQGRGQGQGRGPGGGRGRGRR